MEFNLAQVHEAVAAAVPDREAIVWRDRRLTYADVTDRTRRLANHLLAAGLQPREEREALGGHQSGQAPLACQLPNGNEHHASMLRPYTARVAPLTMTSPSVTEKD